MTNFVNAALMAAAFQFYHFTRKHISKRMGYFSFIVIWLTFEYIHTNWELAYPWFNLANSLSNSIYFIQWFEFTGSFGGSLWILTSNLLIYFIVKSYHFENKTYLKFNATLLTLWIVIPSIISFVIFNKYEEKINPVEIVIVQPNIDPYFEKFDGLTPEEQLNKMLQLAATLVDENTNYILGPETALPQSLWIKQINKSPLHQQLKQFNEKYPHVNLVLGASLNDTYEPGAKIPATARKFQRQDIWYDNFNSAIQFDFKGKYQIYHKSKLVHGVESMPFPELFRPFQESILDFGGTTGSLGTQENRAVFNSFDNKMTIAPIICWESVFTDYNTEYVLKGAQLLFILTNDGWWDDTPGYHQHFAYARLRAIENRRSIARSANTGISGFINQKGEIIEKTPWWQPAVIKQVLNANDELTFYTKNGDYIGRLATFMTCILLLWSVVKSRSKNETKI
jgi:apolipoprotein N-acyltransferase